ncbi:MAG: sugar phosphate nucleotidyltransferase [Candidatus Latescibacter sp.]|nr:sugar phosphate nucleotidyltransferase [Candidatus Latescibacter sp.]
MQAIIPMAGSGTRLRPLTYSKPKALLRVGSKPIISHIVDMLLSLGCDNLILIVSREGANIPLFVQDRYPGIGIETIIQEERLGLGHAVNLAADAVHDDELIVMYGDTIIDGDLSHVRSIEGDGVIAVKTVQDPRRFGVVELSNGIITKFEEKPAIPKSNLAIVGFNYFKKPRILFECLNQIIAKNIRTRDEFQITDAFDLMLKQGLIFKPLVVEGWYDCGTPESLLETNRFMLDKGGHMRQLPDSIIIPPVFIPDNAEVTHSIIGPHVSIGDHAIIQYSLISDSIIGSNARVIRASLVGSLIGDNAEIIERPRRLSLGDNSSLDFELSEM